MAKGGNSKVGNWGKNITFQVNSKKVLTFGKMSRTVSAGWTAHEIVGKKPKYEFTGPDASKVEISDVLLSAYHGVKPRKMIETLEKAIEKGTVDYLYIGGKKIGKNKMKLESMSESWDEIWNKGELVRAKVDLTFSEYR